jgi:hypothetical protein
MESVINLYQNLVPHEQQQADFQANSLQAPAAQASASQSAAQERQAQELAGQSREQDSSREKRPRPGQSQDPSAMFPMLDDSEDKISDEESAPGFASKASEDEPPAKKQRTGPHSRADV